MEIGRPYSRLLHRLERFNALCSDDRRYVAELPLTVANFAASQEVARRGDTPSRCTLVLSGFLYGHKALDNSRRQITSLLVPGDIADLNTLHLSTLDHSISALGPAVVAFLPHTPLKYMLDRSPHLARAFWREAFLEAAILREWVVNLGRREALAKVAHLVCELAVRLQAVDLGRNLCFSVPWTQSGSGTSPTWPRRLGLQTGEDPRLGRACESRRLFRRLSANANGRQGSVADRTGFV
jgi:CRP-like cAMP-binding protein